MQRGAEEAERGLTTLTHYARAHPCHLTAQRLAEEQPLVAKPQAWKQQQAGAQLSVAQRQAWVRVSVAQDDWRVSRDHRLGHRAAKAFPL